jgi:lipopolysaccharide transport system permease protein
MSAPEILIEAGRDERRYWADLWRYRELFYYLAWRDILVRYKQTFLGVAWAAIRPLLTMGVFTLVFGKFANLPSDGVPYPILVFTALLPWQFFSTAVSEGSGSLVNNAGMISKIYFPRLIVPAAAVAVSMVDFLVSLAILALFMALYGVSPGWRALWLPCFMLLGMVLTAALAILFAALNVRYRDFRYVVGFVVQFGLFVSPVGFSLSVVPERWQLVYGLNPMVGIIEGFRWCLTGAGGPLNAQLVALSAATSLALLAVAIAYFRGTERSFADVI